MLRAQARALFEGETLDWAYESLRLFSLCEATRWAHLPVEGGWYAQHPLLIDEFDIISGEKADFQRREQERERLSQKNPGLAGPR